MPERIRMNRIYFQETSTNFLLRPDIRTSWLTLQNNFFSEFSSFSVVAWVPIKWPATLKTLDSRRGCRARINFNSELKKQREPAAIDSPVLQLVNLIIANQLFDWLFSFFLWRCQYARSGFRLIGFQRTNRLKFIIQSPALIWDRDFPTDRTGTFPTELRTKTTLPNELLGIFRIRKSSGQLFMSAWTANFRRMSLMSV